jgi:threonine/homoserine/homoserine lactone efflux protein
VSAAFLLTTLVIVASPGTGVIYTLAAGLSRGARASLIAAFGCTLGIVPHVAAAMLGLAAVLHASAVAFNLLKYAGVAYLLYMAWGALREHGALRVEASPDRRGAGRVIRDAVLINLLNPKLSIFFVAFLPQFVAPGDATPMLHMAGLSAVFMAVTFAVFAVSGVFAAAMRDRVLARPRVLAWLRRSFAAAFAGLAVKLALAQR